MICPVCNVDTIVVERHGIEVDYCVDCAGIWFDQGELDLLMKPLESTLRGEGSIQLRPPSALPDEKPRKCPLCRKKMEKMLIGKEPGVLVDTCPRGDGLWFDGGELGSLIKGWAERGTEDEEKILSFLGDFLKGSE